MAPARAAKEEPPNRWIWQMREYPLFARLGVGMERIMGPEPQMLGGDAVNVRFGAQIDDEFLLMPSTTLRVAPGAAAEYGLMEAPDPSGCAVVLDALVEAHRHQFGPGFTPQTCSAYLQMKARHWLGKAFGRHAYYSGFTINGCYAYERGSAYTRCGYRGLPFDRARIQDGDALEVFAFQDSLGMDYYTYFTEDGERVSELALRTGEVARLSLEGLMYAYGGPLRRSDRIRHHLISPVTEAQIVTVDACTGNMSPVQGAVTDERDGTAAIAFDTPGEYNVSALGGNARHNAHLALPWLKVVVS